MPLFEMSPNVQERETLGRKRSHDEYADDAVKTEQTGTDDDLVKPTLQPTGNTCKDILGCTSKYHEANTVLVLPPITHSIIQSSPSGSPCLTEGGSSTPAQNSPSPQTPTKSTTDSTSQATAANAEPPKSANPAAKRKKLTADEKEAKEKELLEKKEAKEKELAEKKREREEKAAQKAAEKAKLEEEKAIKAKEREEKRKKKEEEERKKADEREEKKRQKEEEQQRIQDEKDKKLRSQPKLSSFFAAPKTPKKATLEATSKSESPLKTEVLATTEPAGDAAYRKRFQEFFIRDNVTVAKLGPQMDDETRLAKAAIVDECIAGHRSDIASLFNPCQLLALPHPSRRRGKLHQSVKHVMEVATNSTAQNNGHQDLQAARKQLEKVPLKIIAFSRDVRPPYYGTLTSRLAAVGQAAMVKQCKNSAARVLPLDYDYDSEAEWQEDEGEDLELDDEEEELDDEDDLDGFLDDSEDSGLSRSIFANTMEPDCTGVCFEDENRTTPEYSLRAFKMEMINSKWTLVVY